MEKIIGIDLGTSTSEVGVMKDGKPVLVLNELDREITPSVVGVEDGKFIVGERAEGRILLDPENTAWEVKRKIGTDEKTVLGGKAYTAVELSAEILKYLKKNAESCLQEEVTRAVITVPAYFTNQQRNETIEAGKLAGLKVERIINEPTAAALCYGIDHMEEESHILIYDLGGGTFDVTLLEMFDGVLEVKASSGNNALGGKDFDQLLINHFLKGIRESQGVDLSDHVYATVKLREEALKCKFALSNELSYEVNLPMLAEVDGKIISFQEVITRTQFEDMIQPLVKQTLEPIQTVLGDSNIRVEEINLVLLVGGSTKIPYVREYVSQILGQEPKELVNPDLAVALGATIQAGIIGEEIDAEDGIMITDVASHSLGTRVSVEMMAGFLFDDKYDILIPRNITIPVSKTKKYQTSVDNQKYADIHVYQGEREIASENTLLGEFTIGEIPRGKAGKQDVEVTFSYDLNGILQVSGLIVSTGQEASIEINMKDTESAKNIDVSEWELSPNARKVRSTIRKAERLKHKLEENEGIWEEQGDLSELEQLIYDLKVCLIEQEDADDMEEIEELEEELLDKIDEIQSIYEV